MDEVDIAIPQMNDYAISKWANEMQIRNSAIHGTILSLSVVRLFNTYGPGEYYHPIQVCKL